MVGIRRWRGGRRSLAFAAGGALLAAGCVGSTPRADFNADLQARGGGVTAEQFQVAAELVADEVAVADADDLQLISLSASGTARTYSFVARRGDQPDFVDTVVVRDERIVSVEPVQDAGEDDLDALSVAFGDLPVEDTEALIDQAIVEFGDPDTVLTRFGLSTFPGNDPTIRVDVESPRRTGTIVYDLDGELIETDEA